MKGLRPTDHKTLRLFRDCRRDGILTAQQVRTLRGQLLAGDAEGAFNGLQTLLARRALHACDSSRET